MFRDWYGHVIRRYAYFVENGHSWEYDKKEKKYRWLGKDHPYKGGKTKNKEEGKTGGKPQEEEEETDSEMPPLEPVPGIQQNDGEEEEEDSRKMSTIQTRISGMLAKQVRVGSGLTGTTQARVGKILNGLNGTPRNSSTKTWMIGGRTTKVVEKMTKMVKAKSSFAGSM